MDTLDSQPHLKLVIHADKTPAGEHPGRFNAPTTNEVAALIVDEVHGNRDIILRHRDEDVTFVSELHRCYDCLQYPLLFPHGEDGYHLEIQKVDPTILTLLDKKVSCKAFYAYRLMVRENDFNLLLRCHSLTNQFLVDMYCKVESERLKYIRSHQDQLRATEYVNLEDAMRQDGDAANVGKRIILPSTFIGSPQYMNKRMQDAMTYLGKFGKPDLFITFTCNPTWPEIKENVFAGQLPEHRHDIVARVFHAKLKKMLFLLKVLHIFGPQSAWMYTVEWQKRGLPHVHMLAWCQDRIHPVDIDRIVSAELPDQNADPQLHSSVTKHMIHGPCGDFNPRSPCMKNKRCSKRYPRDYCGQTCTTNDGYPIYRRRDPGLGGHTATIRQRLKTFDVDNAWIVPFNPLLSKTFNAHINVEYCSLLRAERRIAIACASSGIAATLLQGGRTVHSAFKLPMDIRKKDNPIC
ncbi:uncharacterized protein LOC115210602 [Octopus sinensis]|uniref:ATP-dependent DNA helicase n=1 Tax=Octopus sinensis TaxID=2607531 RepID=A0A6P7SA47_9MOLL|nr:uncharacterized protein LOC115210602 [Octopus sinensis]